MTNFITDIDSIYVCNTASDINWSAIIDKILVDGGHPNFLSTGNLDEDQNIDEYFAEEKYLTSDIDNWEEHVERAGYNWKSIRWIDFEMVAIDPNLVRQFETIVGASCLRCFISKVDPGVAVSMHWDEGDVQYRTPDNIEQIYRYTCFINEPVVGQTLIVNGRCFHNEKFGNVYRWGHYTDFHGCYNISSEPQYLLHFLGYKK